ncbi:MAG: aldo/keto reductase [Thermoplasmata archaeon]
MIPTRELGPGVSVGALGASFGVLNGRPWVVKDIQATAGRLADFGVTYFDLTRSDPDLFLPVLGALGEAGGPPRTISLGVGFEPPRYDDPISAGARANAFGTIDAGSGEGPNVPLQQRIDRFVSRAEKMLRGSVLDLVLVSLEEGREEELRRAFDRLEALTREGRLRAWGVSSGPDGPYQERIQMGVDAGADVVEVPYNLLDRGGIADLRSKGPGTPIPVVVADPLASGRLGGAFLAEDRRILAGPSPPTPIRELQRSLGPVLQLGFLTEGRHRTLAQAALQFALHDPRVSVAVVPALPLERWPDYLGAFDAPGLSPDEIGRIEGLGL